MQDGSKMTAAILKNRKIAVSVQWFEVSTDRHEIWHGDAT